MPTPRLGLPYIVQGQAQKEVTHNDALNELDALVALRILDRDLTAPPASPSDGDAYLVKATATGAWAGQDGKIASCLDGGWRFYSPFAGLAAYISDEAVMIVYSGSSWIQVTSGSGSLLPSGGTAGQFLQKQGADDGDADWVDLQNLSMVGVNTTADSTNKLAVKSAAVLFDNVGNGVQFKVNKTATADTASLLFQTNYSERAEVGLIGDNNLTFKVSPDGSTFKTGFTVDNSTGAVNHTQGAKFSATMNFSQYIDADTWTLMQFNTADHNDFGAFSATTSRFTAPVAGYYLISASMLFKQNTSVPTGMYIILKKNGTFINETQVGVANLVATHSSAATSAFLKLAAGDYVEAWCQYTAADGYVLGTSGSSFFGARIA